jgi:hypothetical protein
LKERNIEEERQERLFRIPNKIEKIESNHDETTGDKADG